MTRIFYLAVVAAISLLALSFSYGQAGLPGLYPDLQTVVPRHLQIVNKQQREILRFSNGIANTGPGHWRMRAEFPISDSSGTQDAIQEILDEAGNVVQEQTVSQFAFHPEHNHWHIDAVALFEIRYGNLDGPVWGAQSIKTTFCLIDWYTLEGNAKTPERNYFDCNGSYQGISPGWVDQYHQSTEGQQLDLTGAQPGIYFLVSTVNPDGNFLEATTDNNTAWVEFRLTRNSRGNPKIESLRHSPCVVAGLCGEQAPNR